MSIISMAQSPSVDGMLAEGRLTAPFDHRPNLAEAYYLMAAPAHDATPPSRAFVDWLSGETRGVND
ncbi:MAG: hypothetical protein AAF674_15805 [Pseudomonadota bacterium]